jgi:hypothetical protein
MEVSGRLHAWSLHLKGKNSQYPLDRRMGGPQSRYGHGGEEKNSQLLPGLELPIIQPAYERHTTKLSRLLPGILN